MGPLSILFMQGILDFPSRLLIRLQGSLALNEYYRTIYGLILRVYFSSGVIEYVLTDHCPTFMNLNSPNVKSNVIHTSYCFRPVSVKNEDKFIESLMEINWDTFFLGKS